MTCLVTLRLHVFGSLTSPGYRYSVALMFSYLLHFQILTIRHRRRHHHHHAHSLPLTVALRNRGGFKRFHHQGFLFHFVHQPSVGMVSDNADELRMVIAHNTRAVDDHIVHIPLPDLVG